MADVEAKLIVKVVDQATKVLQNIKSSMGGIQKSIQDNKKEIRDFGLKAVAVGGAITVALGFAVEAAREQIQAEKQLNAVLDSTKGAAGLAADEVKRMASSLQSVTNFSDEAILQGQNMLLTFTKIGKDVFPQASEAMLNLSQALGQDLKTSALQLGKALNDPINSLDALSRAGVQFTEEQRNMIKAMVESGNVAGAQGIIMEELGRKVGGSARAAADPMVQLKNTMNDVQEEIGKALIPVINDLVKSLLPVIHHVMEWVKEHPQLTQAIVVLTAAVGGLLTILGSMALAIVSVSSIISSFAVLAGPGGLVLLAVSALVAGIAYLITHFDELKAMAGAAIGFITDKLQGLLSLIELVRVKLSGVQQYNKPSFDPSKNLTIQDVQAAKPRAGGGRVSEDLTLVGEQGPELVSLPRGSYVHTASESRGMMSPTMNIGPFYISKEVDADSVIRQITRAIQLQQLQAA